MAKKTTNTNTKPSNHFFAYGTGWSPPIKPFLLGLKEPSAGKKRNIEFIKTVTIRDDVYSL